MKLKFCAVIFLMLSIIFGGCLSEKEPTKIKLGMIKYLNASEENMNELIKKIEQKQGERLSDFSIIYYDNLSSMQMDLATGNIDEMSTYQCVSNYIIGRDKKFVPVPIAVKLYDSFCCAFREEDAVLKDAFDKALQAMIDDGTLINLTKKYITNLTADEEPPATEMPHIAGAATIKVAVTGDLPPLDLVLANGTPAGFNTAVLAEISKRIGKNLEIIDIDSGARASALQGKVVDVLFWARQPDEDSGMPSDVDRPAGIIFSTPYFSDKIFHLAIDRE